MLVKMVFLLYSCPRLPAMKLRSQRPRSVWALSILPTKSISSLTELYSLLLERGWSKDTCAKNTLWSEENPVVGQSAVTALLVQKLFGGEILSFPYSNSTHYFNCIDGCFFDLTFEELNQTKKKSYPPQKYDNLGASPKRPYKTHGTKLDILINNCGI